MPHHTSAISDLYEEIAKSDSNTDVEEDSVSDLDDFLEFFVDKKENSRVPVSQTPRYHSKPEVTPTTSNQSSTSYKQQGVPTPMYLPWKKTSSIRATEHLRASTVAIEVLVKTITDPSPNIDEEIRNTARAALHNCILAL